MARNLKRRRYRRKKTYSKKYRSFKKVLRRYKKRRGMKTFNRRLMKTAEPKYINWQEFLEDDALPNRIGLGFADTL